MGYYPKMTGQRLYLSPVNPDDADKYIAWMNDPLIAGHFGQSHRVVGSKGDLDWLFAPPTDTQRYAIVLKEGDTMIGVISLQNIDHLHRTAFFGIFIGEAQHRGKGYGAEAIRLLLAYGFDTLNLNNIMLSVNADNVAAISCYEKVGFKPAGRRREWVFKGGKYIDRLYMDMLVREFES